MRATRILAVLIAAAALLPGAFARSPKKIVIGTGSAYKQVCFLDEKNHLTGFEVEALKEVNKLLPQYEFEFKILDFNAILISLETGKIDLAAHQFEGNPDRRAKFLYADEGVTRYDQRIAVKDSRNDIRSLEDLARIGGTVQVGSASTNNTYLVNKWNKEHGNRLKVVLAPEDPLVTVQNMATGRIDALVAVERITNDYKATYGARLKVVGDPISLSNAYYLYRRNDPASAQLKRDVDGALAQLKDNGTLRRLSSQWLGADFIPPRGR